MKQFVSKEFLYVHHLKFDWSEIKMKKNTQKWFVRIMAGTLALVTVAGLVLPYVF